MRTTTRAARSATPDQRRIAVAFGLAIGLHLAAIGLDFLDFQKPIETIGALSTGVDDVSIEMTIAMEEPAPPDIETPVPMPTPVEEYLFTEAEQSPPPVSRNVSRPIAKVRRGTVGSPLSSSARALALSAPWPEYPPAARQNGITGDGVAMMTIDPIRGSVTHVSMWKSTGNGSVLI